MAGFESNAIRNFCSNRVICYCHNFIVNISNFVMFYRNKYFDSWNIFLLISGMYYQVNLGRVPSRTYDLSITVYLNPRSILNFLFLSFQFLPTTLILNNCFFVYTVLNTVWILSILLLLLIIINIITYHYYYFITVGVFNL